MTEDGEIISSVGTRNKPEKKYLVHSQLKHNFDKMVFISFFSINNNKL